jgi:hypothetical protein
VAEQAIVRYTEKVAAQIAQTYAGAPFDELRAWVVIAHQREAMVTKLYDMSQIEERLGSGTADGVGAVVRDVVASIWAHEESHTRFLGSLRSLTDSFADMTALQGCLEGEITRSAVSGGLLARALIAVGGSLGRVPDFAMDLRRMTLRQLVGFHGELETTARMGYQRILDLARMLDPETRESAHDALGLTFDLDIAKIRCEENFHQDAFHEMVRWVAADGESFIERPRRECAQILHDLCERNLSIGAVRQTLDPSAVIPKGDESPGDWVSDGGLGKVFAGAALTVPVLAAGAVASRLRPSVI